MRSQRSFLLLLILISSPVFTQEDGIRKTLKADHGDPPGWIWVQQFGGTGSDMALAVTSEPFGNMYVAGTFSGTMILGDDTLNSIGPEDFVIMKLSPTGYPLWHRQVKGTINEDIIPEQVHLDNNGNVIVIGYFNGESIDFNGTILNRTGLMDIFIAKYSSSGTFLWATGYGLADKSSGNTKIVSDVSNTHYVICSSGYYSVMLKFNGSGQLLNEYSLDDCKYVDIEINGSDLYVTGTVRFFCDFGGGIFFESWNDRALFIGKMDLTGNYHWVKGMKTPEGGRSFSEGLGLAVQSSGNICLMGYNYYGSFIWDEDTVTIDNNGITLLLSSLSADGQVNWTRMSDTSVYVPWGNFENLLVDDSDNLYITGYGPASSLFNYDGVNIPKGEFVLKCDHDGIGMLSTHLDFYPETPQIYGADKLLFPGSDMGKFMIKRYSSSLVEELSINSDGNSGSGSIYGLDTDSQANLYAIGYMSGEDEWNGKDVKEISGAFVSKQNSRGEILWTRKLEGCKLRSISYDEQRNALYCSGYLYDSLFIANDTLLEVNGTYFLLNYNSEGNLNWIIQYPGETVPWARDISIDNAGNVIISADVNSDISVGDSVFQTTGNQFYYSAKFNSNGEFEWAYQVTSTENAFNNYTSTDRNNMIYFASNCYPGNINFNGNIIDTQGDGQGNILFGKLDPDGNMIWIKTFGRGLSYSRYYTRSYNIATDPDGYSYLFGRHSDSVYFDDILLRTNQDESGNYSNSFFVAKIDPQGDAVWVRSIHQRTPLSDIYQFIDIELDEAGNFYVCASYQDTLLFEDDYMLVNSGESDMFIAKYSINGNINWIKSIPSTRIEYNRIEGMAVFDSMSVFVGGTFYHLVSFDQENLISSGSNGFVALLSQGNLNCDELSVTAKEMVAATCSDKNNGEAEVVISNALLPLDITWDEPLNSDSTYVDELYPGQYYYVRVTDKMGCSSVDSIMISSPDPLMVNKTISDPICPGENEGFIDLSVAGGTTPYSFDWSNGSTSEDLNSIMAGLYSVTVSDSNDCILVDTTILDTIAVYQDSELCLLTVNNQNKIIVVWEKAEDAGIVSYRIYREETKGNYILIKEVPFDSLSIYLDNDSEPEKFGHYYKIAAVDACGNESEFSEYHKSIKLNTLPGLSGEVVLQWEEYLGFDYGEYRIYRGRTLSDLNIIETISSSSRSYTDPDPPAGQIFYRVEVVKQEPCIPTAKKAVEYGSAVSNFDEEIIESVKSIRNRVINIYPHPLTSTAMLECPNPDNRPYSLIITDLAGKVVRTMGQITSAQIELNRGNLASGTYIIELRGENIYRGKLLVE